MSRYHSAAKVIENYEFDIDHAGIIIGPKGSGIESLKEFPGVISVYLDTRRSPTTCYLKVQASDRSVCEQVYYEIQRRISRKADSSRLAKFKEIFIDSKEAENEIHVKIYDQQNKMPFLFEKDDVKSAYTFDCFRNASLEDCFSHSNIAVKTKISYKKFSRDAIKKVFEKSLSSINISTVENLEYNVSPGKIVFVGKGGSSLKKMYLTRNGYIDSDGLKPVYVTFLNPSLRDNLLAAMKTNGFENLNEDAPEAFTIVHLYVGKEKAIFSVKLALDENLEEIKDEKSDARYSEEKKTAIERVFRATTVGEVLAGTGSPKLIYRKLTLLLHPDKNSHPGATEAFKKLQHAYETISGGKSKLANALKITSPKAASNGKPPKVLNVKTDKTKICTLTTFSDAALDLRASLVTYAKDPDGLSQHVRNALNECWEKRDSEGGIPLPDGKTGICINCIKQVTASHIWAKEITTSHGTYLLEAAIKEIREKTDKQKNYENCLEVDTKIVADGRKWEHVSPADLTEDFLKIKEEWEKIFSNI